MRITAASLAVALALAAATTAQSPLTTTYAGGNGLGGNTMMWFDLTVTSSITITQIDVNALAASTAGSIDVYTRPGSRVGFETSVTGWTLHGNVAVATPSPANTPTVCTLTTPFTLTPGSYGVAIAYNGGLGQAYTNGPLGPYTTAELTLIQGGSGGIWTGVVNTPRVFNGSIHYQTAGGNFATKAPYGTGCYNRPGSYYEMFATAAAFDLNNTSLTMIYNGSNGYVVLPGTSTFVAPSLTATTVANGDDVEQIVTLAGPLSHAGGTTSALAICSNGYVSTATGNLTGFTPTTTGFLAFPQTCWANWHDFNPLNGGAIKFEEVGSRSIVTWNGVFDFAAGGGPSTFQMQFDRSNGNVHIIWQTMSAAAVTNGYLVGFKVGGAALDPGNRDISATLAATFLTGRDTLPLALDSSARPIMGTSINLVTTNFPANSGLGANILSFTQHNPGLDLTGLGMAGCRQFTGLDSSLIVIPVSGSASRSFNIPNNPVYQGTNVFSMSAAFSAGANPLGVVTSNGLRLGVNLN